jgi:ATP-dependent exoDNAse (exonuclease V) alpha subunit
VTALPAAYVREHVELGYASTAHRAQGRTVDSAHAYVNTATVREPLYVMATRGRESNRLYVDTCFDPDQATHEAAVEDDPLSVLQSVIKASGADVSATETRRREETALAAPWRLRAEGAVLGAASTTATQLVAPH